ncbi:hypothetical protein [Nocardia sp. NPDC056000]|uniref:hypothetical protein n=1 Tax=Nocardia sp. NPDC056000 TaxID=3345674 RepID=UPI0035DC78D1
MTSVQPKRFSQIKLAFTAACVALFVAGTVRLLTTGDVTDMFAKVACAVAMFGAVTMLFVSLVQDAGTSAAARKPVTMRRKVGAIVAGGVLLVGLYIVGWTTILADVPRQALLETLLFVSTLSSGWSQTQR